MAGQSLGSSHPSVIADLLFSCRNNSLFLYLKFPISQTKLK